MSENSGQLIRMSSVMDQVMALFDFPGAFIYVTCGMERGEMFRAIKHNYTRKQAMVDAGLDSWFYSDPYEIANWAALFTPIESALWSDIRSRRGLHLWPQLPVDRFFVDFGNPVAKVAVECDGAQWHQDKEKDAARDRILNRLGWRVFRIPGWQCKAEIVPHYEMEEMDEEEYERWRDEKTPYATLEQVRRLLEMARSD